MDKVSASSYKSPLHICLFQPEIPQNTGNIGRLSLATGSVLHLIKPIGFSLNDYYLKRAGLDYWEYVDLRIHDSFADCLGSFPEKPRMAFLSTKAEKSLWEMPELDLLVFGRETSGLPDSFREQYPDSFYKIPMFHEKVRSLNLATSAGISVYEQLRWRAMS